MFDALIVLIVLVALGLMLWEQKRYTGGARRRDLETPLFCEWCISRDGETCSHPGSPVYGRSCGPVCAGDLQCDAREVAR